MSLLDVLTGGKTSEAEEKLAQAQQAIGDVQTPTVQGLSLPQLEQYVNAGIMTPAQAQAYLQNSNAYDNVKTDPGTTEAEMTALSQMQDVAGDSGMTPEMRAQLAASLNAVNTNTQGERASIEDKMAQRGISSSLLGPASQMAAAGQDAQTANLAGTQAAGQAEQNALTAMANSGNLAGNINQQEFSQGAQKAAAQNAINQWNAENKTNVSEANANRAQAANAYNTETTQDVSNANTGLANKRTQYNANLPQTVFSDEMQKAAAKAGVSEQQANQDTLAGEQQAGLIGGILGGASQIGAAYATPVKKAAEGGIIESPRPRIVRTHDGGVQVMDSGGSVPGEPVVHGDSPKNDRVKALLSPGEGVIPRSIMTAPNAPDRAKAFVAHLLKGPKPVRPVHPEDLRGLIDALSSRREATA